MRIVVKIGTNVLRGGTERIHRPILIEIARQLVALQQNGHQPVLVTSGAIFAGREVLNLPPPKKTQVVAQKQMLAAVGQGRLLSIYQQIFELYGVTVAQALLTRGDLADRTRYLNARNAMQLLLEQKNVIPVINENDVVAIDEIKFGDNDSLSALVANLIEADLLILLTDQEGLFTADPRRDPNAQLIREVKTVDDSVRSIAGGTTTGVGTGGMSTKVLAAELATRSGTDMVIARGYTQNIILRIIEGEPLGTRFPAPLNHIEGRKRWILAEAVKGRLWIDEGATQAVRNGAKSLLVVGVTQVDGTFARGEVVEVVAPNQRVIARGLAHYKAPDLRPILGRKSSEITPILGFNYGPTAIHRDNLVVL